MSARPERLVSAGAALYVVGSAANATNVALTRGWCERGLHAVLLPGPDAERLLRPGDVAIGRLDVLPTPDGIGGRDVYAEVARALDLRRVRS